LVFSDYAEAHAWYNEKHTAGFAPVMVTSTSLTSAVNFTECFPDSSPEGRARRDFIEEENKAWHQKVKADLECATYRRGMLENLEGVREDAGNESDHSSDESDVSRSTASLESELEARVVRG
jgi:hypothetical protein